VITLDQALNMQGGLDALMQPVVHRIESNLTIPYPAWLYLGGPYNEVAVPELASIGRYIASHPRLPWTVARALQLGTDIRFEEELAEAGTLLDEWGGLGLAAVHAICTELFGWGEERWLADLPMPAEFRKLFRDWVRGKVNVTEQADIELPG
jgi:hypothetical protein